MKGRLVIEYSDKCSRIDYLFEESFSSEKDIDYIIWITLPRGRNIDITQIKLGLNKYLLRKLNGKTYASNFPDRLEMLKQAYNQDIDLFDSCKNIEIKNKEKENVSQIITKTSSKVIINDGIHSLSLDEVNRLEKEYEGHENVYFYVEGNDRPLSLEEYHATVELINEVVEKIKLYNLSPLEAAIYAYDFARDRIYVSEEYGEEFSESRDLFKALFGDKIVCVGYARIFSIILNQLGMTSSLYTIKSEDGGHAITIARITDKKYDIDGIYYFDPTRGRKLDKSDNHFFDYKAFATGRGEALVYGYYKDETLQDLDYDTYKAVIERVQLQNAHFTSNSKYYSSICNISKFLDGKTIYHGDKNYEYGPCDLVKNTSDMLERLDLFFELINQEIDPRKKMEAIARVRRIEYYENSEKYPFSPSVLSSIGRNSQPWCSTYCDPEGMVENMLRDQTVEYQKQKSEIDLIKVLKKVKEQKEK